jgi:hypothetical protein
MNAIHIAGTSKDTVKEMKSTILCILENKDSENNTKIEALKTLREMCKIESINISDCTISINEICESNEEDTSYRVNS